MLLGGAEEGGARARICELMLPEEKGRAGFRKVKGTAKPFSILSVVQRFSFPLGVIDLRPRSHRFLMTDQR